MSEAHDLFSDLNLPADPNNLTDLEKKHLPVISVPETVRAGEPFPVTVEVGKLLAHPNEHDHYIQFIDLYFERVPLTRIDLTGASSDPKVTFTIRLQRSGKLRAFEYCNLHGTWEGSAEITVS